MGEIDGNVYNHCDCSVSPADSPGQERCRSNMDRRGCDSHTPSATRGKPDFPGILRVPLHRSLEFHDCSRMPRKPSGRRDENNDLS